MQIPHMAGALAALLLSGFAFSSDEQVYGLSFDDSSGRPVIDITINGQGPFPFVFDTGAGGVTVRPELAEQLGLTVTGQGEIGSPIGDGGIAVDLTRIDAITAGGAEISDVDAMIVGFGAPGQVAAMGVIGPAAFSEYGRVAYYFGDNRIEIGGTVLSGPDSAWLPIAAGSFLLNIPVAFNDTEINLHIDTGNPGIVSFPLADADNLPLNAAPEVIGQARTIDREFDIYAAPITINLNLSDAIIPLTQAMLMPAPFGNVGNGALEGTTLEIDWNSQQFLITGTATPRPLRRRRSPPPEN